MKLQKLEDLLNLEQRRETKETERGGERNMNRLN